MSQVAAVLDVMGEASAKAQGLKTAITSGISHFKNFLNLKNMKLNAIGTGADKPLALSSFPVKVHSSSTHKLEY